MFLRASFSALRCLAALGVVSLLACVMPVRADYVIRGLVARPLPSAVPAEAVALRVAVFGDASGARFEPRLLPAASSLETGAYYAPPSVAIDWKGWKTLVFPLADFKRHAEANPNLPDAPFVRDQANRIAFALTGDAAKIFCDDIAFTASPEIAAPATQDIDALNDLKLAWSAAGDYQQRQSIRLGLNQIVTFAKSGGSLQIALSHPVLGEESINAAPLKATLKSRNLPYVVYVRPLLAPIYPASTPSVKESVAKPAVRVVACADSTESLTFAVFAARELKDATVKVTKVPLSESGKTALQPENIALHVVKVWNQAGTDGQGAPGMAVTTPELLVKDDRIALTGAVPDIPLTGDPVTTIAAGQSKQFWITVRVPKGQPPSTYTGALTFSAPGAKPTIIPLVVDVPAMRLRSPFLQYGVQYNGHLTETGDGTAITPARLKETLADIRDHGFRFVSLADPLPALTDAVAQYDAAGMSAAGPLIITTSLTTPAGITAVEALRDQPGRGGLDIYYANADPKIVRQVSRRSLIEATIPDQVAYDAAGDGFDVAVYPLSCDTTQKAITQGKRQNPKRDWWTWSLGVEDGVRSRLYAGYYLFQTGANGPGLYGAFPAFFQSIPTGTDAYNETALTAPGARPQLAVYPAKEGNIPTLQWEAARMGVNDIRYITNLKTYARELKDKIKAGGMKDAAGAQKAVGDAETYLAAVMKKPLVTLSPEYIEGMRSNIAGYAIKLLNFLRRSDAAYPD